MICDYCQRPISTDSLGRCRECGAQHHHEDNTALLALVCGMNQQDILARNAMIYNSMIDSMRNPKNYGALLGGAFGALSAAALFKGTT